MSVDLQQPLISSDYKQADCLIGIVHVGFGAFHRAHQAVYIDDYMQQTRDLRWGIAAVNLRGSESDIFAAAQGDDGYVLKTLSRAGDAERRVIRSHVAFRDWAKDQVSAESLMALDTVELVTITVTESGYYFDDEGGLNLQDPIIAAEIGGGDGKSIYAYLANGLHRRMTTGGGAISLLCCDNIRGNGHMLERNLSAYVKAKGDRELLSWMETHVTFPCSMVDRITPKPKPEDSQETAMLFGREGDQTIMAEDFIQWVIEDKFAGSRPALDAVGVTITPDVNPYEEAKIRILNGGHTSLAYLAALAGLETFDLAMADPRLNAHFRGYEETEVLPALSIELPFDKTEYLDKIAERFSNSNIADTIARICMDGYSKFPVFIRPTLEGCFEQGHAPVFGIKSVASWYVFARLAAKGTLNLTYNEPNWSSLEPLLEDGRFSEFANSDQLWSDIPKRFPEFEGLLAKSIEEVERTWLV